MNKPKTLDEWVKYFEEKEMQEIRNDAAWFDERRKRLAKESNE